MENEEFIWQTEQFDDIKILRYQVPAFDQLNPKEKILIYYLAQAAIAGRDILWDQNNKYNLRIRRILELGHPGLSLGTGILPEFQALMVYAKKVFFANGIHHHYSMDKFKPEFSKAYFQHLLIAIGAPEVYAALEQIIFDSQYMAKRVVLDEGKDLIEASANNYYSGVTQTEVEQFYRSQEVDEECPVSRGLNSTLVKKEGQIAEEVWKVGGKYGNELSKVVYWLEKAVLYACNDRQQEVIRLLIAYYQTGDLKIFDRYSIEWLKDTESAVDFINGFIEVYGDPLAYKASWESVVEIVDHEACERTRKLASHALWFEQHAPIDNRFKKTEVKGVIARVMQVAMLGGDCHPATPIGINLPNAEWIRERYGSKSVTLDNITYAYDMAASHSGVLEEFAGCEEEKRLAREFGSLGSCVHTDLHECLGPWFRKNVAGGNNRGAPELLFDN